MPAFRLLFTSDREHLRAHLLRLAELPGLARVVPFHGSLVDTDAPGALRAAAAYL